MDSKKFLDAQSIQASIKMLTREREIVARAEQVIFGRKREIPTILEDDAIYGEYSRSALLTITKEVMLKALDTWIAELQAKFDAL